MTTFLTLKNDIEEWYPHSDYTTALKNSFVLICEAQIRRRVRVRQMETVDEAFAVSSRSTTLPTGFISMRSVSADVANKRDMDYLPPHRIRSAPVWELTGNPQAYTLEGDNLVVAPVPSASMNLQIVYFKAFDALSGDSDTNWLLANAYDVYLYGSLRAACEWAKDVEAESLYAAKFDAAVQSVNKEHRWSRLSGDSLKRTGGRSP